MTEPERHALVGAGVWFGPRWDRRRGFVLEVDGVDRAPWGVK